MGWNLPDGCTDADIDRAAPGYYDEPEEDDEECWRSQQCADGECAACQDDGECGCHCHPGAKLWDELTTAKAERESQEPWPPLVIDDSCPF